MSNTLVEEETVVVQSYNTLVRHLRVVNPRISVFPSIANPTYRIQIPVTISTLRQTSHGKLRGIPNVIVQMTRGSRRGTPDINERIEDAEIKSRYEDLDRR